MHQSTGHVNITRVIFTKRAHPLIQVNGFPTGRSMPGHNPGLPMLKKSVGHSLNLIKIHPRLASHS
jgi:hypothetical protein